MSITKDDLHSLVDNMGTNEQAIQKAYRLLSNALEEMDQFKPIPLPGPGLSANDFFHFIQSNSLSPEDVEEMLRNVEEFDRLDNLTIRNADQNS